MEIKRVAITGSSGYLGSRLVSQFLERGVEVLGIDVVPSEVVPRVGYQELQLDICSRELQQSLVDFAPDTIVHFRFISHRLKNEC